MRINTTDIVICLFLQDVGHSGTDVVIT